MSISAICQVCDDIRFEANGKAIIIGLFTTDIAIYSDNYVISHLHFLFTVSSISDNYPEFIQMMVTLPDGQQLQGPFSFPGRDSIAPGRRGWQLRGLLSAINMNFTTGQMKASVVCDGQEIDVVVPEVVIFSQPSAPSPPS
jgi:hypothetical protein